MKNRNRLALLGIAKMFSGIAAMGLLLFGCAGTLQYPGAWRMLAVMFLPMLVLGGILLVREPALLEKRLNMRETESEQKSVIAVSTLIFVSCFLLCGIDFRFGWSRVPGWITVLGCFVFLASYLGFAELLRENAYLSRTVEIQDDQQVVSTGLYGIVRHPMYLIILFLFYSMPLIIGSLLGLIPLLGLPPVLVKRIRNEEAVLEQGLAGYRDYEKKVPWHLIPYIW